MNIKQQFDALRPWITQFTIDNITVGGEYDTRFDRRLTQYFERQPECDKLLEMGCLECGHSIFLAKNTKKLICLEGKEDNIERATLVKETFKCSNIEIIHADLETTNLEQYGPVDVVWCVGVLYHVLEPWRLVENIAKITNKVFLWTHYVVDGKESVNGYQGTTKIDGPTGALSGITGTSFWLTKDSLVNLFKKYYNSFELIEETPIPAGEALTAYITR